MIAHFIPEELRRQPQWVGFRLIGGKKTPVIADEPSRKARSNDSTTWRDFPRTLQGMKRGHYDAVAYALNADYTAIDLDDCVTGNTGGSCTDARALAIVNRCNTYTERSVSGGGVHILLAGNLPKGKGVRRNGVEIYSRGRFIILTGDRLSGTPSAIQSTPDALACVMEITQRGDGTEQAEIAEHSEQVEQAEQIESIALLSPLALSTLPKTIGERNRAVFNLARVLKADLALRAAPLSVIRPVVRLWFDQALPVIRTKSFDETWGDFVIAWPRVSLAHGEGVAEAWKRATERESPPEAGIYDSEPVKRLVALCRELAASDGGLFLSSRTAARLLGVSSIQTSRYLKMLCADGLLALAKPGTATQAARYKWLGSRRSTVEIAS